MSIPAAVTTPVAPAATDVVVGRALTKRYGEGDVAVDALRGVDVAFAPGSFTAIMGPSGSGKSTLMHILAGLDQPTSGSVEIAGTELAALGDHDLTLLRRSKVGFIFQSLQPAPGPHRRGERAAAAAHRGRARRSRLARDADRDRRARRPAHAPARRSCRAASSSGSPWRARSITRPAVVFADEPTGNLDSASGRDVLDLLRRAVDEFGQTIVMVTHDAPRPPPPIASCSSPTGASSTSRPG